MTQTSTRYQHLLIAAVHAAPYNSNSRVLCLNNGGIRHVSNQYVVMIVAAARSPDLPRPLRMYDVNVSNLHGNRTLTENFRRRSLVAHLALRRPDCPRSYCYCYLATCV